MSDKNLEVPRHLFYPGVKLSRRGCASLRLTIFVLPIEVDGGDTATLDKVLEGTRNSVNDGFFARSYHDFDTIWRLFAQLVQMLQRTRSSLTPPSVFLEGSIQSSASGYAKENQSVTANVMKLAQHECDSLSTGFIFPKQEDLSYFWDSEDRQKQAFKSSTILAMVGDELVRNDNLHTLPINVPSLFRNYSWLYSNQDVAALIPVTYNESQFIISMYTEWSPGHPKPELFYESTRELPQNGLGGNHVVEQLKVIMEGQNISFDNATEVLMDINKAEAGRLVIYLASCGYLQQAIEAGNSLRKPTEFIMTNFPGEWIPYGALPFLKPLALACCLTEAFKIQNLYLIKRHRTIEEKYFLAYNRAKQELGEAIQSLGAAFVHTREKSENLITEQSEISNRLLSLERTRLASSYPSFNHEEHTQFELSSITELGTPSKNLDYHVDTAPPETLRSAAVHQPGVPLPYGSPGILRSPKTLRSSSQSKFATKAPTHGSADPAPRRFTNRKEFSQIPSLGRHQRDTRCETSLATRSGNSKWDNKTAAKGAKGAGGKDLEYVLVGISGKITNTASIKSCQDGPGPVKLNAGMAGSKWASKR